MAGQGPNARQLGSLCDLRVRLRPQASARADGHEGPAGRQGGKPRRDDLGARPARAGGLHDLHRRLPRVHARRVAERPHRRGGEARHQAREEDGPNPRRPDRPAPRQRALRREVLDARDDGHRPQPGAVRPVGEGPREADRRRPVRARLLSTVHLDVRAHRARHPGGRVRRALREGKGRVGSEDRCRRARQGPRRALRRVQGHRQEGDRQAVSARPDGAAARCDRSRVPVLERRAGDLVPRARAHQPRARHGGERAGNGLRQPRRQLRHRCRVHSQRGDGREQAVRRLPGQRTGRRRRRRHPQHRGPRDARHQVPRDLRGAARDLRQARDALPRHVRHRVHDRAGQALDAADARRQAHRCRRPSHGGRHDEGPPHQALEGRRRPSHHRRPPRPGAAPAARVEGHAGDRDRARGLAWRCGGPGVLHGGRRRRRVRSGREGHPRPAGDFPRGRPRDECE